MSRAVRSALLLAALAWLPYAGAQTFIPPGNLAGASVWNPAGSPYILSGDVTVPAGSSLIIQAGTQVHVAGSDATGSGLFPNLVELILDGTFTIEPGAELRAQAGTAPGTWYGIRVRSSSNDLGGTIRHARDGVRIEAGGAPQFLIGLTVTDAAECGVRITGSANVGIGDSTFTNLPRAACIEGTSPAQLIDFDRVFVNGVGLVAIDVTSGDVFVSRTRITGSANGIRATSPGGQLAGVAVQNSVVAGNGTGIAIDLAGSNPAQFLDILSSTIHGFGTGVVVGNGTAATYNSNITGHGTALARNAPSTASISHSNLFGNTFTFRTGDAPTPVDRVFFRDPNYFNLPAQDFRLTPASPSANRGLAAFSPPNDFDGNPRPFGYVPDIGAYELQERAFQEIEIPDLPGSAGKQPTDPPFTLSPVSNSTLPVTLQSLSPGVCTVAGNTVTLTGAVGHCFLQANQFGDSAYFPAQIDVSFPVGTPGPGALSADPPRIDFSPASMRTRSAPRRVTVTNGSPSTVNVTGVSSSNPQFVVVGNTCLALAAAGSCAVDVAFDAAVAPVALNGSVAVDGTLSISAEGQGALSVALAGTAEKSLTPHFYQSILGRDPDAGGHAFWNGEAARMQARGANLSEAWFAMAQAFFSSLEYTSLNRNNADFVRDLYRTFFSRLPDPAGDAFWQDNLQQGMPRDVAMVSFMFSLEFFNFTRDIFGDTAARPEVDTVMDFYRGLLSRLPDDGGLAFWIDPFRVAQCLGAAAVTAQAEAISRSFALSPEYAARGRDDEEYVADMYNAFLRRGGDLPGVLFWVSRLASGTMTREELRLAFVSSPEFQARVQRIIDAGCLP